MSDTLASIPKNFSHRIALLKQGEHLCSVYADTGELLTQAVPYIKAGLRNGERCIYVADQHSKETIIQALNFWGVSAEHEMNTGRLVFWTRHNYRQPGLFDLNTMLSFIKRTLSEAVADGHAGIRLAVEMSWTLNNEINDDDLVRWEDFINTISFPGSNISFIWPVQSATAALPTDCQGGSGSPGGYPRRRHLPECSLPPGKRRVD